jgi:PIN domain nuclease of toxin-antitoxin system
MDLLFKGFMEEHLGARRRDGLMNPAHQLHASAASLWEIAIKVRLGKLPLSPP